MCVCTCVYVHVVHMCVIIIFDHKMACGCVLLSSTLNIQKDFLFRLNVDPKGCSVSFFSKTKNYAIPNERPHPLDHKQSKPCTFFPISPNCVSWALASNLSFLGSSFRFWKVSLISLYNLVLLFTFLTAALTEIHKGFFNKQ